MRTTVQLQGFAELEAKLKALGPVAKRASVRAMRRAGNTMAEAMRESAPVGPSGNLKKSITITARTRSLAGLGDYAATLKGGGSYREAQQALRAARAGGGGDAGSRIYLIVGSTAPHAHLVEFGTVERQWKSNGKSTGAMPANPFGRAAWEAKKDATLLAIRSELTAEIARLEGRGPKIRASKAGLLDG